MPSKYFWSSSPNVLTTYSAWGVGFDNGIVGDYGKGNGNNVRCVR